MDFKQLYLTRQSCRRYDPERPISREDIIAIVEAGRHAPSACNSQPWRFTVCLGRAQAAAAQAVQQLSANKFAANAPCLIVISEGEFQLNPGVAEFAGKQRFVGYDIGLTTAQITLAAAERGISSCIMGVFDEAALQKLIGVEQPIHLVIALGYAEEGYPVRAKNRQPAEGIYRFIED